MDAARKEIRNPYRKRPRSEDQRSATFRHQKNDNNAVCPAASSIPKNEASALVVAAADKAGMEGIDRAAIDAIILKESGNSLFMQQQRRRDEKVNARIEAFRERLNAAQQEQASSNHHDWRQKLEKQIDNEIPQWIASRPSRSVKVVVDMDAFYMNCELLSRPDIAEDMPACVGGPSMILTSNYAARRFGVRSAMPGYIGEALVQQLSQGRQKLRYCPSNFELYKAKSLQMRQALSEFDPNLAAYSLDEVYMDVGPYLACSLTHPDWTHEQITTALQRGKGIKGTTTTDQETEEEEEHVAFSTGEEELYGQIDGAAFDFGESLPVLLNFPPTLCLARIDAIVSDMRERVRTATGGLTCSAGVAPNFLLAKIASDRNKPNGQLIVSNEHQKVTEFLHPLPTRKVSGIGRVTEKILNAFGIFTVEHLYNERALVRFLFEDSSTAAFLLRASVGCSSSDGKLSEEDSSSSHQKGISRERTMQPGKSWAELNSKLEEIAQLLSQDMQRKNLSSQTVTVKVKMSTYDCLSRSRTLPRGVFVQSADDLLEVAAELMLEIRQKEMTSNSKGKGVARALFSVRLLGIRCSNLVGDGERRCAASNQRKIDRFFQNPPPTKNEDDASARTVLSKEVHQLAKTNATPKVAAKDVINPYSPKRSADKATFPTRDDAATTMKDGHDTSPTVTTTTNAATSTASPPLTQSMQCPVCGVQVCVDDNDALNSHLDACLNGTIVRQAIREESARADAGLQRRKPSRSLTDFFRSDTAS